MIQKATFKQDLTLEADINASKFDISKDIEHIKNEMKKHVNDRVYTVSLIKPHQSMAIGKYSPNHIDLFIPKNVTPEDYRQQFVKEFKKLGFTDIDIELYLQESSICDYYNIKLSW